MHVMKKRRNEGMRETATARAEAQSKKEEWSCRRVGNEKHAEGIHSGIR